MNPESDHELRTRFAAQRRADHELAPAWNPRALPPESAPSAFRLPRWIPLTVTAGICMLLSLMLIHRADPPDLVEALPVLFDASSEPLFTSLNNPSANPSDFLLPSYLSIQLP
jgi:hypothetical protein